MKIIKDESDGKWSFPALSFGDQLPMLVIEIQNRHILLAWVQLAFPTKFIQVLETILEILPQVVF